MLYTFVCYLLLTITIVAAEDECPSSSASASAIVNLKKKLLCNYDTTVRPVKLHTTITNVTYNLYAFFFVFDDWVNSMEIHGWSSMRWKDEFLVWNKSENSGVDQLLFQQREIWMPDIDIDTPSSTGGRNSHHPDAQCKVTSEGVVTCSLATAYMAHCNPDLRRWPFDSHNCVMIVSSDAYSEEELDLQYTGRGVDIMSVKSDNFFRLVNSSCISPNGTLWPYIKYTFDFERHSSFLVATLFVPNVVMVLGTLTTFCLDPQGHARFLIISGNIIAHCVYILYLAWYLPANGDTPPALVIFTRDSFLLVGCSLVITLCAGGMKAAARAPPAWICTLTDGIIDTPGADYLLFTGLYSQSDTTDEVESSTAETFETLSVSTAKLKWQRLVILMDRTSLLVFTVILAAISFRFIP